MTDAPDDRSPIQQVQDALSGLDPAALVTGFVAVVQWAEQDGSQSLSLLHTPMAPWQLYGLLTYGRKHGQMISPTSITMLPLEDGEDF